MPWTPRHDEIHDCLAQEIIISENKSKTWTVNPIQTLSEHQEKHNSPFPYRPECLTVINSTRPDVRFPVEYLSRPEAKAQWIVAGFSGQGIMNHTPPERKDLGFEWAVLGFEWAVSDHIQRTLWRKVSHLLNQKKYVLLFGLAINKVFHFLFNATTKCIWGFRFFAYKVSFESISLIIF